MMRLSSNIFKVFKFQPIIIFYKIANQNLKNNYYLQDFVWCILLHYCIDFKPKKFWHVIWRISCCSVVSIKVVAVSRRFGRTQPDGMLQNKERSKDLCDTDVAIRIW